MIYKILLVNIDWQDSVSAYLTVNWSLCPDDLNFAVKTDLDDL